jgi:glucokinase
METDSSSTPTAFIVGVDIGGSKVAAGLVSPTGEIHYHTRVPMLTNDGPAAGLATITQAIDQVCGKAISSGTCDASLRGIGICCPGPLDPHTGIVINPPNLPCWRNFPLADEISRKYKVPVKVDNDANAAALAEALWGAGRGYRNIFLTVLGTGIGTGIVFDGRIYHGRTGAAGEGGHVSIDYRGPLCGCGKAGCIEAFASGPAIAKRAQAKLSANRTRESVLLRLAQGQHDGVTPEMIGEAYAEGDPVAAETLRETVELLSVWLGNMIDLLEPDVIIVGGGVGILIEPFLAEIRELLPTCCVNRRCQEIPLLPAFYGGDAGIAGGAALAAEVLPYSALEPETA